MAPSLRLRGRDHLRAARELGRRPLARCRPRARAQRAALQTTAVLAAGRAASGRRSRSRRRRPRARRGRSTAARPRRSPTTGTTTCSWATPATRRCGRRALSPRRRGAGAARADRGQRGGRPARRGALPRPAQRAVLVVDPLRRRGSGGRRGARLRRRADWRTRSRSPSTSRPTGCGPASWARRRSCSPRPSRRRREPRAALLAAEGVHGPLDVIEQPARPPHQPRLRPPPAMLGGLGACGSPTRSPTSRCPAAPTSRRPSRRRCARERRGRATSRASTSRRAVLTVAMEELARRRAHAAWRQLLRGPQRGDRPDRRRLTHEELDPAGCRSARRDRGAREPSALVTTGS